MNKLYVFLAFVAGGVCGVLGTKTYFEDLYRRQYEEDLESVKKVWTYKKPAEEDVKEDDEPVLDKEPRENEMYQYAKILQKKGYTNYSDTPVDTSEMTAPEVYTPPENYKDPYPIPPDILGSDGYDQITLFYTEDKVLLNEDDTKVDNIEDVVGLDSLNHFGEYEEDVLYVRNERLRTDYEVLMDPRTYSQVLEEKPYLYREDE